jgi:uncharacterized membrane protein YphA (DoxX/SURF4 family)
MEMGGKITYKTLNFLIALVWVINGLYCNFVPRHQEIVSRILGEKHSNIFTIFIGLSEIVMAIWIISNIKSKINAVVQIVIILIMNTLELILAKDLLMWGKFNFLFALIFVFIIYLNEFVFEKKTKL